MKYFLPVLLLLSLAGCAKDDPALPNDAPGRTVVCRAGDGTRSAPEPGTLALGKQLENPFSLENMQEAIMSIKTRSLPLPLLNRMTGEMMNEFIKLDRLPFLSPTHLYVRFDPKNTEELDLLQADTTLVLYAFPLDYEILGEGEMPRQEVTYDPETLEATATAPVESLYASVPVTQALPEGIAHTILEYLFIPDDMDEDIAEEIGIAPLSPDFSELLIDQSMYLTKNISLEDLQLETRGSSGWNPQGVIRAYDDHVGDYVAVPHAKVRTRRWFTTKYTYTDKNGYFRIGKTYKRPANYSIAWESHDWDVRDGSFFQAYYNGPKRKGEWNLDINNGKSLRYATITRALYHHFYGPNNPFERVGNQHKTKIAYLHKSGGSNRGWFSYLHISNITPDIAIYKGSKYEPISKTQNVLQTTYHELGHCAMFHNCGGDDIHDSDNYTKYKKVILESWATMIGWYMTTAEYEYLQHPRFEKVGWDYDYNRPVAGLSRIVRNIVYFDVPHKNNLQGMSQLNYENNAHYQEYSPIFIDLIDNSNQKEYHRLFESNNKNIYPDDKIYIKAYAPFMDVFYQSRNIKELKANLLANCDRLGTTREAIEDYFAFYNI